MDLSPAFIYNFAKFARLAVAKINVRPNQK